MIDIFTEEALCVLFGLDIDADGYDTCDLEELLQDKASEDGMVPLMADFMERLCGLIDIGESPLSKKRYKGFHYPDKKHQWLIKTEVKED